MRGETVIPVISERIETGKRKVKTGTVRIRKTVQERQRTVQETLAAERVEIARIPKNRPVSGPQPIREEGETIIIPVVKEVLRIERDWILVEEVRLTRRRERRTERYPVTLREEQAVVQRVPANGEAAKRRRAG